MLDSGMDPSPEANVSTLFASEQILRIIAIADFKLERQPLIGKIMAYKLKIMD